MAFVSKIKIDELDLEDNLNDDYGTVTICGFTFDAGTALKKLDPIAFHCAVADEPEQFQCDACGEIWNEEEDAYACCPFEDEEDEDWVPLGQ